MGRQIAQQEGQDEEVDEEEETNLVVDVRVTRATRVCQNTDEISFRRLLLRQRCHRTF